VGDFGTDEGGYFLRSGGVAGGSAADMPARICQPVDVAGVLSQVWVMRLV